MSRRTADALRVLAPLVPSFDRAAILDIAATSPGLRLASPQAAAWGGLTAHVRHLYTDYDALLDQGYDRASARHFCAAAMREILAEWGCRHPLDDGGSR